LEPGPFIFYFKRGKTSAFNKTMCKPQYGITMTLVIENNKGTPLSMWLIHEAYFLSNKYQIKTHKLMHHVGLSLFVHQTQIYN
jgi:hypothetical protein